jgi:uncharacterized protein YcfJ
MQITSRFVFSLVACALLGGCAGVSSTRIVGNTVGAAGGALLGKTLGKGSSLSTALGAGGGLLLSETLQAGSTSHAKKSYAEGYEKGRSDSIKRQYQALNERQRFAPQSDDATHLRLFDVPLPEREQNGVILAPGTATLRIQE